MNDERKYVPVPMNREQIRAEIKKIPRRVAILIAAASERSEIDIDKFRWMYLNTPRDKRKEWVEVVRQMIRSIDSGETVVGDAS